MTSMAEIELDPEAANPAAVNLLNEIIGGISPDNFRRLVPKDLMAKLKVVNVQIGHLLYNLEGRILTESALNKRDYEELMASLSNEIAMYDAMCVLSGEVLEHMTAAEFHGLKMVDKVEVFEMKLLPTVLIRKLLRHAAEPNLAPHNLELAWSLVKHVEDQQLLQPPSPPLPSSPPPPPPPVGLKRLWFSFTRVFLLLIHESRVFMAVLYLFYWLGNVFAQVASYKKDSKEEGIWAVAFHNLPAWVHVGCVANVLPMLQSEINNRHRQKEKNELLDSLRTEVRDLIANAEAREQAAERRLEAAERRERTLKRRVDAIEIALNEVKGGMDRLINHFGLPADAE